jgi:hypothetical protein
LAEALFERQVCGVRLTARSLLLNHAHVEHARQKQGDLSSVATQSSTNPAVAAETVQPRRPLPVLFTGFIGRRPTQVVAC